MCGGTAVADGGGNGTLPATGKDDQEITARTSAQLITTQGTCAQGGMQLRCVGAGWGGDQCGAPLSLTVAAAAHPPCH